jgi:hypothetical protein
MPLRQILGAAEAHGWHLMLAEIVLDRELFESGERSHDEIDFIALDQFDCFRFGGCRHARGIGDEKFDLATGQREVLVFEEARDPFLKMNASGGEPAGFYCHEPDLDRPLLRYGRFRQPRNPGSGASRRQKSASA